MHKTRLLRMINIPRYRAYINEVEKLIFENKAITEYIWKVKEPHHINIYKSILEENKELIFEKTILIDEVNLEFEKIVSKNFKNKILKLTTLCSLSLLTFAFSMIIGQIIPAEIFL
jgi:hypothetical protein